MRLISFDEEGVGADSLDEHLAGQLTAGLRSAAAPPTGTVLIDAEYLAASLGRQGPGRQQREFFAARSGRPVITSGPSATALLAALSASLLAKTPVHSNPAGDPHGSFAHSDSYFQFVSARTEDRSLSSETPLPPASPRIWGDDEEHAHDELMEFMDEEIEIVDSADAQRSNVLAGYEGEENGEMALTSINIKENLSKLESIDGFIGAALSDSDSGMCIGFIGGGGSINLEVAAAANTEVVRSKRKAVKALNLRDDIEDILISLGKQYHLIRPVRSRPALFYYLVLDRQRSNLAMARYALAETERELPL